MNIQSNFNNQALAQLPQTYKVINLADQFDSDCMEFIALNHINNCSPCLDDMSQQQIAQFDAELIEQFKHSGYVNNIDNMYWFNCGSLYKYDEDENAYVHVYKDFRKNTEAKAIRAYENKACEL